MKNKKNRKRSYDVYEFTVHLRKKFLCKAPTPTTKGAFSPPPSLGGPEERKPILKNGSLLGRTIRREAFVFSNETLSLL